MTFTRWRSELSQCFLQGSTKTEALATLSQKVVMHCAHFKGAAMAPLTMTSLRIYRERLENRTAFGKVMSTIKVTAFKLKVENGPFSAPFCVVLPSVL